jgi:TonB family protein
LKASTDQYDEGGTTPTFGGATFPSGDRAELEREDELMRLCTSRFLMLTGLCSSAACASARPTVRSPFAADACPIPTGARNYQVVARADAATIGSPELNTFLRAAIAGFVPPGHRPPREPRSVERAPYTALDSIFARGEWLPTERDKVSVEVLLRRDGSLAVPRVLALSGDTLLASRVRLALLRLGEHNVRVAPSADSARIVILFGEEPRPGERAIVSFAITEKPVSAPLVRSRITYPPQLREVGIEGEVTVEFIVDAAGIPDMGTFRVLPGSGHEAFVPPVRAAVAQQRFEPAQLDCRPVRQLVREPFQFRLPPPPAKSRP